MDSWVQVSRLGTCTQCCAFAGTGALSWPVFHVFVEFQCIDMSVYAWISVRSIVRPCLEGISGVIEMLTVTEWDQAVQ